MIFDLNTKELIDFGFMALVIFTCARTLLGAQSDSEGSRRKWRAELKELEGSLRELIGEAEQSSSSLDRSLLQRKRELEQLLQRLEQQERAVTSNRQAPAAPERSAAGYNRAKRPVAAAADLPNESWLGPQSAADAAIAEAVERVQENAAQLARARQAPAIEQTWALGSAPGGLASEIEVLSEGAERDTFERMSIMDPTTYKIARRLLIAGKEIHVVARKLDLPVSEIRLLDRLMRREQTGKSSEGMAGQAQGLQAEGDQEEQTFAAGSIERERALL